MPPNGPAIKGVCVAERTQAGAREPDAGIVLVSSRSERGMARVFAVQIQSLWVLRVSR